MKKYIYEQIVHRGFKVLLKYVFYFEFKEWTIMFHSGMLYLKDIM